MTMQDPVVNTGANEATLEPEELRLAFEASRAAMAALDADALPPINLDIEQAVVTVRGCVPELRALAPRLVAVPESDPQIFDKCDQYAHALAYAHREYVIASQPAQPIPELTESLKKVHATFFSDASTLVQRGLLPAEPLAALAGTNGSRNTAFDVLKLAGLLRNNWTAIAGKTAATLAEIHQAEAQANRLLGALGLREQGPSAVPEATIARQRAYALFMSTYDEARRIVTYLRWHQGDVDKIAPSLYNGRTRRVANPPVDPAVDDTVAAPVPNPIAPNAPPAASAPASTGAPSATGSGFSSPFANS